MDYLLLVIVALVSTVTPRELTKEDLYNAKPGHLEYDSDFRKMFPNIPGPSNDAEPFIVGGDEVVPNSRPYQAGMYIPTGSGNSFCGATLISARTVLTAAHCVDGRNGNVTIYLGAHNMPPSNDPNVVNVSSGDIVIHPDWYRPTLLHDVAIVRFQKPVPLNANITPVLLPVDSTHDYLGNTTLVSGWGRPSDSVNSISPVLREVTSFVISNYACRLAYFGIVEESHICISGGSGIGTCNGDSGGPLVINGYQVGVVSFVSSWGCEQGWPPGFARVTYYLDWIHANMAY
ncbi:brachyurin-like isoform X2 [Euwallacea similis]|uniref:brachyurin-like isoform X2 n=1 Tax=Euwallacea similis TaxID=1736056 RepID=UPI00344B0B6F